MARFQSSREKLEIQTFISGLPGGPHGKRLEYIDIEKATGVPMDVKGKCYLRSALYALKLYYLVDRGKGIEIQSADNCISIAAGKGKRACNAVKYAHKSCVQMLVDHSEDMRQDVRNNMTMFGSLWGSAMAFTKAVGDAYKPKNLAVLDQTALGFDPFKK